MTLPAVVSVPDRLAGLRRFAIAITVLNVLGHTVLGFEQSLLQVFVAVGTAYATELLLEWVDARLNARPPRFAGGWRALVNALLSAHITGLAVGMLLYANSRLVPFAFAASAAIASKTIFKAPSATGHTHFFNPSNFGIAATLLLFPWVGISPPYHFTENLPAAGRIGLPLLIIATGTLLNARFTHRVPVILSWLSVFVLQAIVRSVAHGTPITPALVPMTGAAFVLFTFYMVTDPATTPMERRAQLVFGAATAATYGALVWMHVVFGLFFSLALVCTARGAALYLLAVPERSVAEPRFARQRRAALVQRDGASS
ncbi:MAG TPA: hypothetical protein VGP25_03525 [Gemmatimonadaceae bacterium]|nr:hypothetical protein [Gemmatimonadaceae bacterium]